MIKIHNTLTREKELFKPIEENKVRMYICGPTVYNYIHIGNARSTIAFDVIRRYFEYRGYEVNYVSNFTDVDDKIIKAAKELAITAPEVADRFIAAFEEDTAALNVKPATLHPRVINHIPDIIAFIEILIEKGYAYEAQGDVYYRTRKFAHYGELSDQSIDELEVGASQRTGAEQAIKEDPLDFALWKSAKPDEISWTSPWGEGRPGWHIECSVMAKKYLGEEIDIHAGGEDLIFPHHENEIAQSECCNGKTFAHYWLHNGFLNIDNRKMSKSLGNFFTVREIGEQYDLQVLRFFMLSAHYRSPINFSREIMESSKNALERIVTAVSNLTHLAQEAAVDVLSAKEEKLLAEIPVYRKKFEDAMDDDLNTADAISAIFELVKFANTNANDASSGAFVTALKKEIVALSDVLGLQVEKEEENLDGEIEKMIEERQAARKARDFKRADEIRDELLAQGIILEDTREGVKWKRA